MRKVRIWTGTGYFPFKICLQVRMEEGCGLWIYLETETLGNELSRNVSLHLSDRKLNYTSSHSVNFDNIYGLFQTTFGKHGSLQNKRPIFLPLFFFRVSTRPDKCEAHTRGARIEIPPLAPAYMVSGCPHRVINVEKSVQIII